MVSNQAQHRTKLAYKQQRRKEHTVRCDCCGWLPPPVTEEPVTLLNAHHIVPIADGGEDSAENLMLLCPNCHAVTHALFKHGNPPESAQHVINVVRSIICGPPRSTEGDVFDMACKRAKRCFAEAGGADVYTKRLTWREATCLQLIWCEAERLEACARPEIERLLADGLVVLVDTPSEHRYVYTEAAEWPLQRCATDSLDEVFTGYREIGAEGAMQLMESGGSGPVRWPEEKERAHDLTSTLEEHL